MKSLLLISDEIHFNKSFSSEAKHLDLKIFIAENLDKGIHFLEELNCDAIVINFPLSASHQVKCILKKIKALEGNKPIFFIINQPNMALTVQIIKEGVLDCYAQSDGIKLILEKIEVYLKQFENQIPSRINPSLNENKTKPALPQRYFEAHSKKSQTLYEQIDLVADTNYTVIIYGETGTGKESVAKRLTKGIYKNQAYISIDCGCLNKELAASELFGHIKGSFSGAYADKMGAFEAANHGTLFLDEITNLDYPVQVLLLRAIEEKKIKKVGSNEEIPFQVRIITASNEKLVTAVQEGRFREDLFYRLNEFEINIPPLRDRLEDLEGFINFFITKVNKNLNKSIQGIESNLLKMLYNYDWPGNIRELKNIIKRGALFAHKFITKDCLNKDFIKQLERQQNKQIFNEKFNINHITSKDALKYQSLKAEYEKIIKTLEEVSYNKTKAAQKLNINRKTLYNKLKIFEDNFNSEKN